MGLVILVAVGGILGWLATIILRREEKRDILSSVSAGILGSVLGGGLVSDVSILSGISALTLLIAIAAAALAIAAFNLVIHGKLTSANAE